MFHSSLLGKFQRFVLFMFLRPVAQSFEIKIVLLPFQFYYIFLCSTDSRFLKECLDINYCTLECCAQPYKYHINF